MRRAIQNGWSVKIRRCGGRQPLGIRAQGVKAPPPTQALKHLPAAGMCPVMENIESGRARGGDALSPPRSFRKAQLSHRLLRRFGDESYVHMFRASTALTDWRVQAASRTAAAASLPRRLCT